MLKLKPVTALFLTVVLLALTLSAAGCSSPTGSREYKPGKGWVPAN